MTKIMLHYGNQLMANCLPASEMFQRKQLPAEGKPSFRAGQLNNDISSVTIILYERALSTRHNVIKYVGISKLIIDYLNNNQNIIDLKYFWLVNVSLYDLWERYILMSLWKSCIYIWIAITGKAFKSAWCITSYLPILMVEKAGITPDKQNIYVYFP